jgi:hypothetical protein
MRCRINPHLIGGNIIHDMQTTKGDKIYQRDDNFKDALLYTLQDYCDFFCLNACTNNVLTKTQNLIDIINDMDNIALIAMIENNHVLFPNEEDYQSLKVLKETYNPLLNAKEQQKKFTKKIDQ